jgi:hypothetical protein
MSMFSFTVIGTRAATDRYAFRHLTIRYHSRGARLIGQHPYDGIDVRVDGLNALQVSVDDFDTGHLAPRDHTR